MSGPESYHVTPSLSRAQSETADPHTSTRLSLSPPGFWTPGCLRLEGPPLLASTAPHPAHCILAIKLVALLQEAFLDTPYRLAKGSSSTPMKVFTSLS